MGDLIYGIPYVSARTQPVLVHYFSATSSSTLWRNPGIMGYGLDRGACVS
jgi:hypothetical protein